MSKKVLFKEDARKKLKRGVDIVADAVRVTMGPKGRAVIIPKGDPVFTLDGVTVAQSIDRLEDPVEDMGAQLVKNVAQKTNEDAGDGTTTATLLTQALLTEGMRGVEQGMDAVKLKESMRKAGEVILTEVKKNSTEIIKVEQMKNIATISSRDPEIGSIIGTIYDKIGKDGIITTEEVKSVGMEYEIVDGMQIDNGWMLPHFITDMERKVAVLENPYILVTSQAIRNNTDIAGILNAMLTTESKSLLVIADDCQGEALTTLVINKLQSILPTAVIKSPGYGDNKKEHVEDICSVTGATHITEETGLKMEDATLEQLGRATRVLVYEKKTVIVGGAGDKKKVTARINSVKKDIKEAESSYKKTNLERRLAKLQGGVAVIKIGDVSEEASREKQYRIEDAINATKSAIEEGVVIGGGMALYNASFELDKLMAKEKDADVRFGLQMVQNAIRRPAQQILENQGLDAGVVLAGDYTLPDEVIDPLKVERVALEQALSIVGLFLITNAVVYEQEEPKKEAQKLE